MDSPTPAPSSRTEPKLLYRRLNEVVAAIDPRRRIATQLDRLTTDLFAVLRGEIRLAALLLYVERHDGFALAARAGELAQIPTDMIARGLPFLRELAETQFRFLLPAAEAAVDRAGLSPDSAAAILVGDRPNRYLVLFVLGEGWAKDDVEFTVNTVSVALGSRLVRERMRTTFDEAAAIQRSLLEDEPPPFPGYDLACRSMPAEAVGGDFYDFMPFDDEILGIAIGDVSGHGLPAALLVRDIVTGLRMGLERDMKVSHVFRKLNRVIHRSRLTSRFVSVCYGELEQNGNLIYVNAGHLPPLLFLPDRVEELRTGGTIIGPLPEAKFKRGFAHVDRGATLVMATDGIMERRSPDGEFFGTRRVIETVRKHEAETATVILDQLFDAARRFGGNMPWEDDATLVIVKRAPRPA